MNNTVFRKFMKNMRKHRNIKLVTREKKKELFSTIAKLLTYKVFHRTSISNRNEKNRNTYEQTCLFRTFNTGIK